MRYTSGVWLLRPPGVYPPQGDTRLLADALRSLPIVAGSSILDIGTGTGALAVAAAQAGAGTVTAVDVSRRAVWTARVNTKLRRLPVRVRWRDVLSDRITRSYDVVMSNPPYVPGPCSCLPGRGPSRSWEGGRDGRVFLDSLCARLPNMLSRNGTVLIIQSELSDVDGTLGRFREMGLKASVVTRARQPFGPVMRSRRALFERRGLIAPGETHEELVVIRGDRVEQP